MRTWTLLALLALLVACSRNPVVVEEPGPAEPPRDLVAEVRLAGTEGEDAAEVLPLRDPVVEDLRREALAHERARRFDQADAALRRALELVPGDPELLQSLAEVALFRKRWDEAAQLARQSYGNGPRLGALCRRNWSTVQIASEMLGQVEAMSEAARRIEECTVAPPVRM